MQLPCVCHAVAPSVEASGGMPCVCHAVAPSVAGFSHYCMSAHQERKCVPAAVAMPSTERFLGRPQKHAHSRVLFRVFQCLFARWASRHQHGKLKCTSVLYYSITLLDIYNIYLSTRGRGASRHPSPLALGLRSSESSSESSSGRGRKWPCI